MVLVMKRRRTYCMSCKLRQITGLMRLSPVFVPESIRQRTTRETERSNDSYAVGFELSVKPDAKVPL